MIRSKSSENCCSRPKKGIFDYENSAFLEKILAILALKELAHYGLYNKLQ
jgi:hypothetical protein